MISEHAKNINCSRQNNCKCVLLIVHDENSLWEVQKSEQRPNVTQIVGNIGENATNYVGKILGSCG